MFAVIMIMEEEKTEDCVIMTIATKMSHDLLVITPHHPHDMGHDGDSVIMK